MELGESENLHRATARKIVLESSHHLVKTINPPTKITPPRIHGATDFFFSVFAGPTGGGTTGGGTTGGVVVGGIGKGNGGTTGGVADGTGTQNPKLGSRVIPEGQAPLAVGCSTSDLFALESHMSKIRIPAAWFSRTAT
jgi:hypothetical protein